MVRGLLGEIIIHVFLPQPYLRSEIFGDILEGHNGHFDSLSGVLCVLQFLDLYGFLDYILM